MATQRWIGNAPSIAQVDTITLGTYDVTTTWTVAFGAGAGGVSFSTVGTGGTTTTTAAALKALIAASTAVLLGQFTITQSAAVITVTNNQAANGANGETASVSGGTGTVVLATTAGSSPNDVGNTANYASGSLPVNSDTLTLDAGTAANSLLYNLSALSGVTLTSFTRKQAFTGTVGLPEWNPAGFWEYRPTELAVGITTATIEIAPGDTAQQIKINGGSVQTALTITGPAGQGQLNREVVWWRGTNASNVVKVIGGSLAIAVNAGLSATVATLSAENATVRCGASCTLTTVNITSSTADLSSSCTTLNMRALTGAPTCNARLATAIATANVYAGRLSWYSTGTITTLTLGPGAVFDASVGSGNFTITNAVVMSPGSVFFDPEGRTINAGIVFTLQNCTLRDVTIVCGIGRTVTIS